MQTGSFGPTHEEAQLIIKKMNAWAKALAAKPGAAKAFLIKHGFVTKGGKLPKRYGG